MAALACDPGSVSSALQAATFDNVQIDSRAVVPGDLFIALPGTQSDGHAYVPAALAAGAAGAVVRQDADLSDLDAVARDKLFAVPDTMRGLEALGCAARARSQARVIGVTGSVGKTSAKEWLRATLAPSGQVHASEKSYNNHVGVPLTLARMPRTADFGVFEIGMNHAGEITDLVAQVRPHVALVTAVGAAHIAHFDSVADIARAKAEIFSGLDAAGTAIIPADSDHAPILYAAAVAHTADVVSFSGAIEAAASSGALAAAPIQLASDEMGTSVTAQIDGHVVSFRIAAPGAHHLTNALAVLLAAHKLGGDLAQAAIALGRLSALPGRGASYELQLRGASFCLVDESYNANPVSMRAALDALGARAPRGRGRRVAVLGDMAELGDTAAQAHALLASALAENRIDVAITVGPLMASLHDALAGDIEAAHFDTASDAVAPIKAEIGPGDIVMIKGSNSTKMQTIVAALRAHFAGEDDVFAKGGALS